MTKLLSTLLLLAFSIEAFANPFVTIFNGVRSGVGAVGSAIASVAPDPEPWAPTYLPPLKVFPPYKPDGTPNDPNAPDAYFTLYRKFVLLDWPSTVWLSKNIPGTSCTATFAELPLEGQVMKTDRPPVHNILVCSSVPIDAGWVARYFTLRPKNADPEDREAGYWEWYTEDRYRMSGGKQAARMFIQTTIQSAEFR